MQEFEPKLRTGACADIACEASKVVLQFMSETIAASIPDDVAERQKMLETVDAYLLLVAWCLTFKDCYSNVAHTQASGIPQKSTMCSRIQNMSGKQCVTHPVL
jgi:hypothetical protein